MLHSLRGPAVSAPGRRCDIGLIGWLTSVLVGYEKEIVVLATWSGPQSRWGATPRARRRCYRGECDSLSGSIRLLPRPGGVTAVGPIVGVLAESGRWDSGWLLSAAGALGVGVGVVSGYPFEGTFGAPQAIPVANRGPAFTPIASRIGLVHVVAIGHDLSRLGGRFAWLNEIGHPLPGWAVQSGSAGSPIGM